MFFLFFGTEIAFTTGVEQFYWFKLTVKKFLDFKRIVIPAETGGGNSCVIPAQAGIQIKIEDYYSR